MRRQFLLQLMGGAVAGAVTLSAAQELQVAGVWYLVDAGEDESRIPQHRVELKFRREFGDLGGSIVNRNTGTDIPLAMSEFDGGLLRFRMAAPAGQTTAELPVMTMRWDGARFVGYWSSAGAPQMKLIRAGR